MRRTMVRSSLVALGAVGTLLLAGCAAGSGAGSATSATAPAAGDLGEDLLLPPGSMPVWNGAVAWQALDGAPTGDALQICAPPAMQELGAAAEVARDYEWPEGAMQGLNAVGLFGSPQEAVAVAERISGVFAECTGDTMISDLDTGSTWTTSELVDPGADEDARFEFMGVDAAGTYVTIVGFTLTGQDANWESDPVLDSLMASVTLLTQ